IILRNYGWWNLWLLAGPLALQIPRELDSVANAKRIHAPGIFLLAENDEIVPPKFQRLVVDAFAGEKQVVTLPGAYHNSPIQGQVVAEIHRAYDRLFSRGHRCRKRPKCPLGAQAAKPVFRLCRLVLSIRFQLN